MAKRKNFGKTSTGRGQGAHGNTVIKAVAVLLALLAAAYIITSLVFGVWNPLNWGKQPAPAEDGENNVIDGNLVENGVKLLSRRLKTSEYAANGVSEEDTEAAYTLTISRTPADSDVTDFTWTGAFANANSSWASGKTLSDYITVTPAKDNLSAVVACKQAFGEPVLVTVTYDLNAAITATRKFDYVKRTEFEIVDFDASIIFDESYFSITGFGISVAPNNTKIVIKNEGVGTVQGTVNMQRGYLEFSEEFVNYMKSTKYYTLWKEKNTDKDLPLKSQFNNCPTDYPESDFEIQCSATDFLPHDPNSGNYYAAMLKLAAQNTTANIRCVVEYTYTYGDHLSIDGVAYSDYGTINESNLYSSLLSISGINIPESDYAF